MSSRIEKRLLNQVARASKQHHLVEAGDRIMVCLSGGKDSYAMMALLAEVQRRVPFDFSLVAVNLDQHQPGFDQTVISDWCDSRGFEHHMVNQDTYSVVTEKIPEGKTYCSLCSRLRRGALYDTAEALGATKMALGHHRDDLIETLLLNMLYAGQLKSMAARLTSDDGRNTVIRPLAYCSEAEIIEYADEQAFPILPCDLCGSQENLQRKQVKRLLAELNAKNPNVKGNVFSALSNVVPSHLLDLELRKGEAESSLALDLPPGGKVSLGALS